MIGMINKDIFLFDQIIELNKAIELNEASYLVVFLFVLEQKRNWMIHTLKKF